MPKAKRGVLSDAERQKIIQWADSKPIHEIARRLNRTVDIIQGFINTFNDNIKAPKAAIIPDEFRAQILFELSSTLAWKQIKSEFSSKEIEVFKEQLVDLMWQFNNDVPASEKMQILHVIRLEIMMSRVLQEQNKLNEEIIRLESQVKRFVERFGGDFSLMTDSDKDLVKTLENQLGNYRAKIQSHATEYTKLQKSQYDLMKTLKATRDQRITDLTKKPESFLELIKKLQDKEFSEREGRHAELLRLAGEKSEAELAKPHTYADNVADLPIYSPENLKKYDKIKQEKKE